MNVVDRVAELSARTRALEASAGRLQVAEDAERQRFEAELGQGVVPHLRAVESGLSALLGSTGTNRVDAVRGSASLLDDLAARVYAALEELRTLKGGLLNQGLIIRAMYPLGVGDETFLAAAHVAADDESLSAYARNQLRSNSYVQARILEARRL